MPGSGRGRFAGSPPVPSEIPPGFPSGTCGARLGPRPARSRRPFRRTLLAPRRGGDHAQAAARGPVEAWDAVHDAVDVPALEHLVAQQLLRQLLEALAVLVDELDRRAHRLVGEVLLLLVAQPPRAV